MKAVAVPCRFCGELIVQSQVEDWTPEQHAQSFRAKLDSHIDFHVDGLMDEIREALGGEVT